MTKCFYHADMDGKCAAAIVVRERMKNGHIVECFPMSYTDDFQFDKIQKDELIYVIDCFPQKEEDVNKLLSITLAVVWIDHHTTEIEKYTHKFKDVTGLRDNGISGCELTWKRFNEGVNFPEIVRMIGSYEVGNFKVFGMSLDYLQAGLMLYDTNPTSDLWKELIVHGFAVQTKIGEIIDKGKTAIAYRNAYYKELVDLWSFKAMFGDLRAICCNAGLVSSKIFDSIEDDYDLLITFMFDGSRYNVSLYTKDDKIDVSLIAKAYGGGGHSKAAGFRCEQLPFRKI